MRGIKSVYHVHAYKLPILEKLYIRYVVLHLTEEFLPKFTKEKSGKKSEKAHLYGSSLVVLAIIAYAHAHADTSNRVRGLIFGMSLPCVCEKRRLWRDCAYAQALLGLRCSPMQLEPKYHVLSHLPFINRHLNLKVYKKV